MTVSEQTVFINESMQETNPGSRVHCQCPFSSIQTTCSCETHKLLNELRTRNNIFHSLLAKAQDEYSALKRIDTEHTMYINILRSELLKAECSSRRAQAKAEEAERKITHIARPLSRIPKSQSLSVPLRNLFAYENAFKQQEVSDPLPPRSWENSTTTSTRSPSNLSLDSLDDILSQTKINVGKI